MAGGGNAYKSICDVQRDLNTGRLHTVLEDFVLGFLSSHTEKTRLQLVYPNRKYQPAQVSRFIEFFEAELAEYVALPR